MFRKRLKFIILVQTDKTRKFIKEVGSLKESGDIKKYSEIVEALKWNKTSLSNILNGRENISDFKYSEFCKVYGIAIDNPEQISIEHLFRIEVKNDVILSTLAELLAHQRGQTVEKIKSDLVATVNQKLKEKLEQV